MRLFKKWFGWKSKLKNKVGDGSSLERLPAFRIRSLEICKQAAYKPTLHLPTTWNRTLRPPMEIALRLHAIKALVLWVLVPEDMVSDAQILEFVARNNLLEYMESEEQEILKSVRGAEEDRRIIGWKFENAWPLAWFFGYREPEITAAMMSGDQMQDVLRHHSCKLEESLEEWVAKQSLLTEKEVIEKEDLFYCIHNAVRSAQLGEDTVPVGFHPVENGGVIHERRHALTWMLSNGIDWEQTDLST
ncbi:MAG: DUF4272 domain-containing protein [Flavobacteriaceae bacterium]|nr:DUF4272 domain-containing protein [Flavobacteriaceae bacterium]